MKKLIKSFKYILAGVVVLSGLAFFVPVSQAQNTPPKPRGYCVDKTQCTSYQVIANKDKDDTEDQILYKFEKNAGGCEGDLGICTPDLSNINQSFKFGSSFGKSVSIETYIEQLFRYLLGAAGVVAATMLVLGGYGYITSAGNQARVSRSKEFIQDALIGLVLIFGSYILLNFINARLVTSPGLSPPVVAPIGNKGIKVCGGSIAGVCGDIKYENGQPCRVEACDTGVCLPFTFGGPNNLVGYKCYSNDEAGLKIACEEAPGNECKYISTLLYAASSNTLGCGGNGSSCMWGVVMPTLAGGTNQCGGGTRVSCSYCGGRKIEISSTARPGKHASVIYEKKDNDTISADTFYCRDAFTQSSWKISGLLTADWGAVCCSGSAIFEKPTFLIPNKKYGDYNLQSAASVGEKSACGIKYIGNKPEDQCEDGGILD